MIDNVAFTIGPFDIGSLHIEKDIYWYGIILSLALLAGLILCMFNFKKKGHDPEIVIDMALVTVPLAVLGARLYYVIFMWGDIYSKLPFWKIFAVWEGGLAIYGAVIGGLIGVLIYTRYSKKIAFWEMLDLVVPALILGQAIGRWGNFVNQEAYGYPITNPSLQFFPVAVYIQAQGQHFMATFFYESIWNFLTFAVLMAVLYKNTRRKDGDIFLLYLVFYGLGRAVIEGMRTDSLMMGSLRVSQWLSVVLVIGAAFWLYSKHRTPKAVQTDPLDESLMLFNSDEQSEPPQDEQASAPAEAADTPPAPAADQNAPADTQSADTADAADLTDAADPVYATSADKTNDTAADTQPPAPES